MAQPIIEIKNIGKKYNINREQGGYVTLRDVIMRIVRSPIQFAKRKVKQVTGLEKKEEFWALKDVSLEVKKGEVIGIIGPNGAGKSTLLKVLSQITPPTEGEIKVRGKIGSLLEVGTGFHPELSGRENIFLNGAILGMTRKEVAQKFDAIVEFSGVAQFIDTPVKYYSSGMYVRLAFSVAAHIDTDILIVDEVLAVGDADFQKKCLGKMNDITKTEGRTILFVSHNLDAVERLCTRTVLLKKGKIIKSGDTSDIINYYLHTESALNATVSYPEKKKLDGQITKVTIKGVNGEPKVRIPVGEKFSVEVDLDIRKKLEEKSLFLYFHYHGELILFSTQGDKTGKYDNYEIGKYRTTIEVPAFLFQIGTIMLNVGLGHITGGEKSVDFVSDIQIEIINDMNPRREMMGDTYLGKISTILNYNTEPIQ